MPDYHTITGSLIVLPVGQPVYSEQATIIGIDDESGGPLVYIEQHLGCGDKRVLITPEEWPHIRIAIDSMMAVCTSEEANQGGDHA